MNTMMNTQQVSVPDAIKAFGVKVLTKVDRDLILEMSNDQWYDRSTTSRTARKLFRCIPPVEDSVEDAPLIFVSPSQFGYEEELQFCEWYEILAILGIKTVVPQLAFCMPLLQRYFQKNGRIYVGMEPVLQCGTHKIFIIVIKDGTAVVETRVCENNTTILPSSLWMTCT